MSGKVFCVNCGKMGHYFKKCYEPITSCGLICFNLDQVLEGNIVEIIQDYLVHKTVDIPEFNYSNLKNLSKFDEFKSKIKFLMIRRKHSLSYIEFIRGRYDLNYESILELFNLMSIEEVKKIKENTFDFLWSDLWKETANNKIYHKEFLLAKEKYDVVIKEFYDSLKENSKPYNSPEWGFPKGKRNNFEKNLNCAVREFQEETGFNNNNFNLFERINPINEVFYGTNKLKYLHIYYLSYSSYNEFNLTDNNEVGEIGWFTFDQVIGLFREYQVSKVKLVYQVYYFLVNLVSNLKN